MEDNYNYKNPIKIQQSAKDAKRSQKSERRYRKEFLKVDKSKTFEQPIIDLTDEQNDKMDEFAKHCYLINTCITCSNRGEKYCYFPMEVLRANEDNEIVMHCDNCLNNTIDGTKESKEFVKWINENVMKEYDMTFQEHGFPKLMRHKFMGICYECVPAHPKERIEFFDFRNKDNEK